MAELPVPNFLKNFYYSGESFAVANNRLYTFGDKSENTGRHISLEEGTFSLHESEEVSELEKMLFRADREFADYLVAGFNFIIGDIEKLRGQLKSAEDAYLSISDYSVEKFIMIDVLNAYNHRTGKAGIDILQEISLAMPKPEDFAPKNHIASLFGNKAGIAAHKGKTFSLEKYNGGKKHLRVSSRKYSLKPYKSLKQLCEEYNEVLRTHISSKMMAEENKLLNVLDAINRKKENVEKGIDMQKNYKKFAGKGDGSIKVRKLGMDEYMVLLSVPPYIIEKDSRYYYFREAELGMPVRSDGHRVMVLEPPRVLNVPYKHPFVYTSGKICYGNFDWSKNHLKFSQWYSLSAGRGEKLAKGIAEMIRRGKILLERGYVGNPIPVNLISNCDCKIAEDSVNAGFYALNNDISPDRIIKND
ncbi:TPA: hypothetical protein HA239_02650 [Candidatus Woesearchaeota archaeon]|nr:hypothetical protein QT06_C0001G1130 [archaeon GW2011_AR15]MBS3104400.1 hypothetical protein [Candidatus Woesearchaeota archaeon]HIH41288.1 hypothetical protein [Candidatus Woesearchaeota archaeon]